MKNYIHSSAIVNTQDIGENTQIHEFVVIRENVKIGKNVIIHPHCVIASGVTIADGVEIFPGAFIGKEPKGAGAIARKPVFKSQITIGENTSIGPNAVIYYDVVIGNNTLIGEGASIREQGMIGNYCIISRYVTLNYNVKIGNRTKIMDFTHITGNAVVEDDVFISIHVSTTNDNNMGKDGYHDAIIGPHIENAAALGAGAVLLPNTRIGANATIGAGAVVTKTVEKNKLMMGMPARAIK